MPIFANNTQDNKMQSKTLKILYVLLIITCIIAIIFFILYLKTEATDCLKNPFIYGANKLKNVECYCNKQIPIGDGCVPQFYFNGTTFIGESSCSGIKT